MQLDSSVDVIIPVFNQFRLVKACIESVLNSGSKFNLEIIVVNDGSSENELNTFLSDLSRNRSITLINNAQNMGFTKSVNLAMKMHPERDVILLNSDTEVFSNWSERLRNAAYLSSDFATVIPLSNASHISNYPFRNNNSKIALEIDAKELDKIASKIKNPIAIVPTTVGFCMYIKRLVLKQIGYFDDFYFPIGYGEESDFCYRARKMGWRHVVAGNIFVQHNDGSASFGERKMALMEKMLITFRKLHPDLAKEDRQFLKYDPVWGVRNQLDMCRLRAYLRNRNIMYISEEAIDCLVGQDGVYLTYSIIRAELRIRQPENMPLPNIDPFFFPNDIPFFEYMMKYIGVSKIIFSSVDIFNVFKKFTVGKNGGVELLCHSD